MGATENKHLRSIAFFKIYDILLQDTATLFERSTLNMSAKSSFSRNDEFRNQLLKAQHIELTGHIPQAHCVFACAYYCHSKKLMHNPVRAIYYFGKAKEYAAHAAIPMTKYPEAGFSPHDFVVVGTILLRRWLVWRPEPDLALNLLKAGLRKKQVPPHSEALIRVGLAESHFHLNASVSICTAHIQDALDLEEKVKQEKDRHVAWRHFSRALHRATLLLHRLGLGGSEKTKQVRTIAKAYAIDDRFGNPAEAQRIDWEWNTLQLPAPIRVFLPQ